MEESEKKGLSRKMWAARLWSLPAILFVGAEIFAPHSGEGAVPWQDWVLVGLMVLAVAGLIISWRWARVGGVIALAAYLLHVGVWPFVRGGFAPTWWMLGLFVAGPGLLFYLADREN